MITANSLVRRCKYCSSYSCYTVAPNRLFLHYRPPTAPFCVTAPRYQSTAPRGAVPPTLGNAGLAYTENFHMSYLKNEKKFSQYPYGLA